jgi:hypothetical protein
MLNNTIINKNLNNNKNLKSKNIKNDNKLNFSLNNSFNLMNENLENLKTINTGTPEWEISIGNKTRNEPIPRNLQWRPRAPKMKLPAHLITAKGGRRRTRKSKRHASTRHTKKRSGRRSSTRSHASTRSTLRHHRKFD